MPRRVVRKTITILTESQIDAIELNACLLQLLVGIWLCLWNDENLAGKVAQILNTVIPTTIWGCLLITLTLWQLYSISRNHLNARRACALASGMTWLFIGAYIAGMDFRVVGCPISFAVGVSAIWGYWRLGNLQETARP